MGSSEPITAASAFVSARDGFFWRHGRPYRYVGANMWCAMLLDPGRMVRELDRLEALGVQNLRVLGSAEEVSDVSAQATPVVQSRPGEYDEEVLKGLDRLLYEVRQRGWPAARRELTCRHSRGTSALPS
jgi:mannan endo-1,4-beta-mannosidase